MSQSFTHRRPVAVLILPVVTCGLYGIFWFDDTKRTMEARGAELGPTWYLFVAVLNLIWIWNWCRALENVSNGQQRASASFAKLLFLGPVGMAMLQAEFNQL